MQTIFSLPKKQDHLNTSMKTTSLALRLLIAASVLLAERGIAQTPQTIFDPYSPEPLPLGAPAWMREIADNPSGVNYARMDSLFSLWMQNDVDARVKTVEKKPAVNFYRRWSKAYAPYADKDGVIRLPSYQERTAHLQQLNQALGRQTLSGTASGKRWRNIGPNTTQTSEQGKAKTKDSQACVYRLAVAESNPNIVYCGTETGVVFKTTDKGKSWQPCSPLHNFGGAIFALQVSPKDPNTIYAGGGVNLWKSTDGGASWQMVPQIAARVNSIRISPQNPQTVTVSAGIGGGMNGGFYLSTDGGNSFRLTTEGVCHDHELQPGNDKRIYLLCRKPGQSKFEFLISEDGGNTFSSQPLPVDNIVAGRLAVSPAPNGEKYVYALVNSNTGYYDSGTYGGQGVPHILQSTDAGKSWTDHTQRNGREQTFSSVLDNNMGGQGYFDMIIGASSQNPEHVIFGLCSAYRSTQGGKGSVYTTAIGGYQNIEKMHPDMQDIVVCGQDTWISTDGGIKYSSDFFATPGTDCNFGIYAAEYHGFGQGWNEDIMAGGRWHNGDAVHLSSYGEGNTLYIGGVEYATGHVLPSEPRKVYFSDSGTSIVPEQITGPVQTTHVEQFNAKKPHEALQTSKELGFDPRYALRLVMSSREDPYELYVSEDEGRSFHSMLNMEENVSSYEFSRSNPNHIYAAGAINIFHSTDNGKTWKEFVQRPFEDGYIGSVAISISVDPNDENKVWFTNSNFPGRVAYTTDCGATWQYPLDPYMKDKTFNWVVLTGNKNNGVYIGTQGGDALVYYKDDTMTEWMNYSEGLPSAARIARLTPFYKEGKLRAATSQGVWEIPLYEETFVPVAQPMALNLGNGNLTQMPNKEVLFDSYSIVNQNDVEWEWTFNPEPKQVIGERTRNPRVIFGFPGLYDVTLKVTTPQGSHSRTIPGMIRIDEIKSVSNLSQSAASVKVHLTPNGTESKLYIETEYLPEEKIFTLHDSKGRLLHTLVIPAQEGKASVILPDLSNGVYIYELRTPHHKFFGKLLKN